MEVIKLANAYFSDGKINDAIDILTHDGRPECMVRLSEYYCETKNNEKVIECLKPYSDQKNLLCMAELAEFYIHYEQTEEGLELLNEGLRLNDPNAMCIFGNYCIENNRETEGVEFLKNAIDNHNHVKSIPFLASYYLDKNNREEAIRLFELGISLGHSISMTELARE